MRFAKGHKAATRRHIVDVASNCVRRDGISAAGIAGIMGEAGLTKGAFSPHFESKEERLVREALASALGDQQHRLDEDQQRGLDLEGAIRRYLNRAHLEDPAEGCPSAAFAPGNRPPAPVHSAGLRESAAKLRFVSGRTTSGCRSAASRRRATAIFGLMVGTLQFARAVPDTVQAEQILEGGVEAALHLARV